MRWISTMAVIGALQAAPALETDWTIDAEHSTATFTVKHMMAGKVRGVFGKLGGAVHYDEREVSKSTVDVTIAADDIDTRVSERDGHLKSQAFFDVKRFPEIRFKATLVEQAGRNRLRLIGNLTLHGVTRPVELAVELGDRAWKETFPGSGATGKLHWGVTATTTLSRKEFGLTWNLLPEELQYMEPGGVMVGDDVAVELDLELVRPAR